MRSSIAATPASFCGTPSASAPTARSALVVFEYVLRLELSRPFLLLFSAYAWVLLLLFRLTAGRVVGVLRREFAAPHYVMVAGTGERAIRLARALEESAEYGVRLRGFLSEAAGSAPRKSPWARSTRCGRSSDLPAILRQHVVDEIIFAVGSESLADLEEVFLLCDEEGVRTRVAVDFFPARQQHGLARPLRRDAAADVFGRALRRGAAAGQARHRRGHCRGRPAGALAVDGAGCRC